MNAREFLFRPTVLREQIQNTKQRVRSLASLAQRVTKPFGPEYEPVSHTPNPTAMQDATIRLMEARNILEQQKRNLTEAELEVGLVIDRIQNEAVREFMQKKFLDGMTIRMIAAEKSYSYDWGKKKLRKGVAAVQRILDEGEEPDKDKMGRSCPP